MEAVAFWNADRLFSSPIKKQCFNGIGRFFLDGESELCLQFVAAQLLLFYQYGGARYPGNLAFLVSEITNNDEDVFGSAKTCPVEIARDADHP